MEKLENAWNDFLNMIDDETGFRGRMNSFMEKGNKTAGTDVRKVLMTISQKCKELRGMIQDVKNQK